MTDKPAASVAGETPAAQQQLPRRANARIQIGYMALSTQDAINAGINGFAVQLLAESFGDRREKFPDGGIAFPAQDHQARRVWVTIAEEGPIRDRFLVDHSGDPDLPWRVFDTREGRCVGGIHLYRQAAQATADTLNANATVGAFGGGGADEAERLEKALRDCAAYAGHPDAAEGCRLIIARVKSALGGEAYSPGHKPQADVAPRDRETKEGATDA